MLNSVQKPFYSYIGPWAASKRLEFNILQFKTIVTHEHIDVLFKADNTFILLFFQMKTLIGPTYLNFLG